jgi:hypothetical protein
MRFQYVKREAKIERHWFQAKLWDKSPKIDAIVENVKEMVQIPKALVSLQISPCSTFSRYSNISKKKEWMKTFLDSLDNCSDEDKEKN